MDSGTWLPWQRYLDLFQSDAERIAALAPAGLDAPVAPCPGWTVRDVVVHTGQVYLRRLENIRGDGPADAMPTPDAGEDEVAWFLAAHRALTEALTAREPEARTWTWWPPRQILGFWIRRMAQETAVHRVDVEAALGDAAPVPADLAIDGVDEVLMVFLGTRGGPADAGEGGAVGPGGVVSVRTGGLAWEVTLESAGARVRGGTRTAGPAAAVVSGEPSELLLWLWGRRPDASVEREGDEALVAALRTRLADATD